MSDDVGVPSIENYEQFKARLAIEQADKTKQDILKEQGGIDLDNLPKSQHRFVDRGAVIVCEGANHPSHRHWKR